LRVETDRLAPSFLRFDGRIARTFNPHLQARIFDSEPGVASPIAVRVGTGPWRSPSCSKQQFFLHDQLVIADKARGDLMVAVLRRIAIGRGLASFRLGNRFALATMGPR
jgi:hypothetical protein